MSQLVTLNNNVKIPSVGFGLYLTPKNEATRVVREAMEAGYRHVDSARYYANEKEAADAMAQYIKDTNSKREDFFFTTKLADYDHGYEKTKKAIETSLEFASALGYIDLFLVHSPQSNKEKRHGTWMALQEAYESGKVKAIGVSNYGIKHLKELLAYSDLKYKPAVNQVELHPWLRRTDLVEFCREQGIALEAYSPLTRGMYLKDDLLVELAEKYNVSVARILIKWSLQHDFIPLPKSVTKERIIDNIKLDFTISSEDMKRLDDKDCYGVTIKEWDPTVYPLDDEQ